MVFQITNELIALILAIIVPFGGAMFWIDVVHIKLGSLKDLKKMDNKIIDE